MESTEIEADGLARGISGRRIALAEGTRVRHVASGRYGHVRRMLAIRDKPVSYEVEDEETGCVEWVPPSDVAFVERPSY